MADITEDQIAAWKRIEGATDLDVGGIDLADLALIKPFLPNKLTNPLAELPKEAGAYNDGHGYLTILTPRGAWLGSYGDVINPDIIHRPLKRLVEEPKRVTQDEVVDELTSHMEGSWNPKSIAETVLHLVYGEEK